LGGANATGLERQRCEARGRRRPADAAALGHPRLAGSHGHQVQLRHRAVRRVHAARGRPARALVQLSGLARGRENDQDDRRRLERRQSPDPARVDRARCAAVRLLPVRHDHERARAARAQSEPNRRRHRRGRHERVPLLELSPRAQGDSLGGRSHEGRRMSAPTVNRRDVIAGAGAFVLGFYLPPRASQAQTAASHGAAWYTEPAVPEINAWIVVEPDDSVVIRIAQTELGQGVWTSNAMMVAEELQCDWSKVKPIYASANRDAREKAPAWTLDVPGKGATDPNGGGEPTFGNRDRTGGFGIPDSLYRRMRTNAASSVKDGRYYLQLAGAEARERLMLATAREWGVPVDEVTAKDSVLSHSKSGRSTTYGKIAHLAARTPHPNPEAIALKPPEMWTLMGTEQKNLDIPMKVTGETKYAIDVRVPGMKWAAVKSCPVYGGDVKSFDAAAVRGKPGVRSVHQFPI